MITIYSSARDTPATLRALVRAVAAVVAAIFSTLASVHAQAPPPPAQTKLADVFKTADGPTAPPTTLKSAVMPAREPLKFPTTSVPFHKTEGPQAYQKLRDELRDARNKLFARAALINGAVMRHVLDVDGSPRRDTAAVLKGLRKEAQDPATNAELRGDLNNLLIAGLAQTEAEIDPVTHTKVKFKLWSYLRLDETDPTKNSFLCGPLIKAAQGATLLIPVLNLMNRDDLAIGDFKVPDEVAIGTLENQPHGFDVINLHTHGLNVSPSWPADDVFREVHPGQIKFYVYQIPSDHPVGTFWYHPHKHGAAGPQVSGGMAGPLLVTGPDGAPAGLDGLDAAKRWAEEEILIFQQIAFYQSKAGGATPYVFRPDCFAVDKVKNLELGDQVPAIQKLIAGMKEHLQSLIPDASIYNWLNGQLRPPLKDRKTGETFRLRLIHAGTGDLWRPGFQFITIGGAAPPPKRSRVSGSSRGMASRCPRLTTSRRTHRSSSPRGTVRTCSSGFHKMPTVITSSSIRRLVPSLPP